MVWAALASYLVMSLRNLGTFSRAFGFKTVLARLKVEHLQQSTWKLIPPLELKGGNEEQDKSMLLSVVKILQGIKAFNFGYLSLKPPHPQILKFPPPRISREKDRLLNSSTIREHSQNCVGCFFSEVSNAMTHLVWVLDSESSFRCHLSSLQASGNSKLR